MIDARTSDLQPRPAELQTHSMRIGARNLTLFIAPLTLIGALGVYSVTRPSTHLLVTRLPASVGPECLPKWETAPAQCVRTELQDSSCNQTKAGTVAYDCSDQIVSCPKVYSGDEKVFSFKPYDAPDSVVDGVKMPRQAGAFLYRGIQDSAPQFDLKLVSRAILGDSSAYVGSYSHFELAGALTGSTDLNGSKMISEYRAARLPELSTELKACYPKGLPSHLAQRLGALFSDLQFRAREKSSSLVPELIDYHSGRFHEYSPEVMFTSIFEKAASAYGNKVIVLKDNRARGVDLTYKNFHSHGKWFSSWIDHGEILLPGYAEPSDVEGLLMKTGDSGRFYQARTVTTAAFRIRLENETSSGTPESIVAIADGQGSYCVTRDGDRIVECRDDFRKDVSYDYCLYHYGLHEACPDPKLSGANAGPMITALRDHPVPILATFRACRLGAPCPAPKEWLSKQTASAAHPGSTVDKNQIENIRKVRFAKGGHAYRIEVFFPDTPKINVLEASYGSAFDETMRGNATTAAAMFCNGRDKCDYKVSSQFLGDPAPGKDKNFEIRWKCGKNGPEKKTALSAPADGQIIPIECK